MTPTTEQYRFITRKRLSISFGVMAAVVALFGLLGYFWLPDYAKSQLEITLSKTLSRPVTIQSIEVKPYTLELTVRGFHIGEKTSNPDTSETLFSFDELYVDLSIDSVVHRTPIFSAITLTKPTFRLVRETETQFNISDLIEEFSTAPDDEAPDTSEISFSLSNIVIKDGRLELIDQFKQSQQLISDINLGIPFVANLKSTQQAWVEPHFNAQINGAPFFLEGSILPFAHERQATLDLKLTDIDLITIKKYIPLPSGISLLSGKFDSDLVLVFSQAADALQNVSLAGKITLRQLGINNSAAAEPYHAVLKKLDIDVHFNNQEPSKLALILNSLALSRQGESDPVLSLPKLAIDNIVIDLDQQQVVLGNVTLDGFNTAIRREKTGDIDLARLFAAPSQETQTPTPGHKPSTSNRASSRPEVNSGEQVANSENASALPEASSVEQVASSEGGWATRINRFQLINASLRFEDAALTKAAPMVINSLDLTLDSIDLSGTKPLNLALQASVNQHGSINAQGSLAWAPFATDLNIDLRAVDLVSLQGWAGDQLTALLTKGDISYKGNVKAEGEPLNIAVDGQGQLANFNIFDVAGGIDLLNWKTLDIDGINFVNEPLRVDIDTITLGDFFAHVVLSPTGNLNLTNIIRQDVETMPPAAPSAEPPTNPETNKTTPIHISKVILERGKINFNDQFIQPNYHAKLTELSGQIGPLHPNKPGKIDIRGAVDKTAPLEIKGAIDPFGTELFLDLAAKVKDIDLPPFSPYSGKYFGRSIDKGKLSVDIHYHIEKGALSAKNNIFLDQFTLGETVDSPDAISAPLGLAIALLKNRRGEIDIHLPIKGSLNDPQFSMSSIIFDAFINLISRAVTAPFSLLGAALGGGGEELSAINFEPGFSKIETTAEKNLQTLSEALADRPALKLEITGHTNPVADYEGLKLAILERKVKTQKLKKLTKKGEAVGSLDEIELTPEEYSDYLTLAYEKEEFEKPTNIIGITRSLPDEEMKQLILAHIEVNERDLLELAEQRASAAQSWLIKDGGISSDRVFIVRASPEEMDNKKPNSQARFSLK